MSVKALRTDYHMHTPRCQHARGALREYAEAALAIGLAEIGFSDHAPLPNGLGAKVRMREEELEAYVEDVLALRREFSGRLAIRLGIECDHVEGLEDYNRSLLKRYPFDYAIGSVHYLDAECRESAMPKEFKGDIGAFYQRYFTLVAGMAQSGLFDMAGHFDFARRVGIPPPEAVRPFAEKALRAIAQSGMALEVNTSGYRHQTFGLVEPFPNYGTLTQAFGLGIPIRINSDAHDPFNVGFGFDRCAEALRQIGYAEGVRFEKRIRSSHPL